MTKARRKVDPATTMEVMLRSRRRCALCFGLSRDVGMRQGQIAHLDHDPSNNDPDNLCFLCFDHHELFDARTSQAKGFTELEVKEYRRELDDFFASPGFWPGSTQSDYASLNAGRTEGIGLEVYDRRIQVYRSLRRLLISVLTDPSVKIEDLRCFAEETDEALFLFDEEVARYLDQVYQRAAKLRAVAQRFSHPETLDDRELQQLAEEDSEILNWISAQFTESRRLFKRYLTLSPAPNPGFVPPAEPPTLP